VEEIDWQKVLASLGYASVIQTFDPDGTVNVSLTL